MASFRVRKRRAFSLIEVLVVIAILIILISLLLVSVNNVRETANRLSCANNLHQLGVAFHNFHMVNKAFPTENTQANLKQVAFTTNPNGYSFYIALLPYVEQKNVYDAKAQGTKMSNGLPADMASIKEFLCPSRRTVTHVQGKRDYGYADGRVNLAGPSVLNNDSPVPLTTIATQRGTANTMLLTHVWMSPSTYMSGKDPTDAGWATLNNNRTTLVPIKPDKDSSADNTYLGGPHPNVLPTLYCDGRVDNISYSIYNANDGEKTRGVNSDGYEQQSESWSYRSDLSGWARNCKGWYDTKDQYGMQQGQCSNCNNYCHCGCIPAWQLALQLLIDLYHTGATLTPAQLALLQQISSQYGGNWYNDYLNYWHNEILAKNGVGLNSSEQAWYDQYKAQQAANAAYAAQQALNSKTIADVSANNTLTPQEQTAWNNMLGSGNTYTGSGMDYIITALQKKLAAGGTLTPQEQSILNSYNQYKANQAAQAAKDALNNQTISDLTNGKVLTAQEQTAWDGNGNGTGILGNANNWTQVGQNVINAIIGKKNSGQTLTAQEQSILTSYQSNATNTINAVNSGQTLTSGQQATWNSIISAANGNYGALSSTAMTALLAKATAAANGGTPLTAAEQTLVNGYNQNKQQVAWQNSVIQKAQSGQVLSPTEQAYYNQYLQGQQSSQSSGQGYTQSSNSQTQQNQAMNQAMQNAGLSGSGSGSGGGVCKCKNPSGGSCGCGYPCCN